MINPEGVNCTKRLLSLMCFDLPISETKISSTVIVKLNYKLVA